MEGIEIRLAAPHDYPHMRNVYANYVSTPRTFEYELPSEQEFNERFEKITSNYPCLVARHGKNFLGYCYAHEQAQRPAYQWNAELSIYLSPQAVGKRIGSGLYESLIEILKGQNIKMVYAKVTRPNPASEGLHRSLGFEIMGIQKMAGYKNGAWHDVLWYEKIIGEHGDNPQHFMPIKKLGALLKG